CAEMMMRGVAEGFDEARPDCRRGEGRELLATDHVGEPGKSRRTLAQRWHTARRQHRRETIVLRDEGVQRELEIVLIFEVRGHVRLPGADCLHCAVSAKPVQLGDRLKPMPPVFRFAPSPNGYLHLGHALS